MKGIFCEILSEIPEPKQLKLMFKKKANIYNHTVLPLKQINEALISHARKVHGNKQSCVSYGRTVQSLWSGEHMIIDKRYMHAVGSGDKT